MQWWPNFMSLYSFLTLPATIAAYPYLLINKRTRTRIAERYGDWNLSCRDPIIWLHGASFGEVNGLTPLTSLFRERFQNCKILVTAMSDTGVRRGAEIADFSRLLPLDNSIWIRRAIANLNIKAFLFSESEVWPGLITELTKKKTPIFSVNTRISQGTLSRYSRLPALFLPALKSTRLFLCSNQQSKSRLESLGIDKALVVGNTKYEREKSIKSTEEALLLKQHFFAGDFPVIVLGSLRPGEEKIWFPAIKSNIGDNFRVVIAPRHKEKYSYFESALNDFGLSYSLRSDLKAPTQSSCLLLDTLGELEKFYSFADLSFIGGTLVDFGGHNPIEACAYGSIVVVGPHCRNIEDIVSELSPTGAIKFIRNTSDANNLIKDLCTNRNNLIALGNASLKVFENQQGASKRIFESICKDLQ